MVGHCLRCHLNNYVQCVVRAIIRCCGSVVKAGSFVVAYGLLRVEIEELEVEHAGGLPPGLLRPASIEPLDL